jgi:hypothetical protein
LPKALQEAASMYAGCVSGAMQKSDYLGIIEAAGFKNITIQKQKAIVLPKEVLEEYLDAQGIAEFNKIKGIYSITVYAEK